MNLARVARSGPTASFRSHWKPSGMNLARVARSGPTGQQCPGTASGMNLARVARSGPSPKTEQPSSVRLYSKRRTPDRLNSRAVCPLAHNACQTGHRLSARNDWRFRDYSFTASSTGHKSRIVPTLSARNHCGSALRDRLARSVQLPFLPRHEAGARTEQGNAPRRRNAPAVLL